MPDVSNQFEVVWPLSKQRSHAIDVVDELGGLNGKRIALVWDHLFKGNEMFQIIIAQAQLENPTVEFVSYEEFGNILRPGAHPEQVLDEMGANLERQGIDGAIVGV